MKNTRERSIIKRQNEIHFIKKLLKPSIYFKRIKKPGSQSTKPEKGLVE